MKKAPVKAALICIGNELLSGVTVNSNMVFLGQEMIKLGLPLLRAAVICDSETAIIDSLRQTVNDFEIIFITGGLGPTKDDLTKNSVAVFFDKELIFNDSIWSSITERFTRRGLSTPAVNRCQAEVPQDFTPLENTIGTAPGLFFDNGKSLIFLLPGVPAEMKEIFITKVKPILQERFPSLPTIIKTIRTIDIPESELAERIDDIPLPPTVNLAYLPQPGRVDLQLSGINPREIETVCYELCERIRTYIWGFDNETLSGLLHSLLSVRELTLALAESCTGGLIQQMLTDHAGASGFFRGGIIAYSNEAKIDLLGVSENCLEEYGAVSVETAEQMAIGVSKALKTDIGAAVTGIAGPAGGSENKPVGTVCFCVYNRGKAELSERVFPGNRQSIREISAFYLLKMIQKSASPQNRIP